jgi:hypothetical protein
VAVAATSRVARNRDMVLFFPPTMPMSFLLTGFQNANDHAHHTTNAATTDDDLALHLEAVAMLLHNDSTVPTTDPDPATHATARPLAHQNLAVSVVAADLATPTQTAPTLGRVSRPLLSPRRSRAMFKWAMVSKTRTQKPRWLA